MSLWGRLFGRRDGLDLSSISPEDIRTDQIALERQEDRLDEEVEQCQRRIDEIVNDVVAGGKKNKARAAARKVMQLKERIVDKEQALDMISRSLMALGRLQRLVGNSEQLVRSGVLGRLQKLPQADLTRLLCGEMARAEAKSMGLDTVIEMLQGPATAVEPLAMSQETARLTAAFEAAIEAGDPTLVSAVVAEDLDLADRDPIALLS